MSVKLSFKPIFTLEYDQELLQTVTAQVKKYSTTLVESLTTNQELIPSTIKESFDFVFSKGISLEELIQLSLSLYFLERSFVKATESCIQGLLADNIDPNKLNLFFSLSENWPDNSTQILSVYKLSKGSETQKIIQLTNSMMKWVDSFVPITKKHEFSLFEGKFYQNGFIESEDSLCTTLELQSKKKLLVQDQTKKIADLETSILNSLATNKLTLLKADYSSFELKQFLFFIGKKLFNGEKKLLFQQIEFFKIQFAELFEKLGIIFVTNLEDKEFSEQYELINSLRNTPSIVILSEDSWTKFESMNLFIREITIVSYPRKDLLDKDVKDYLKDFTANFIEHSSLSLQPMEKNDLIDAIVDKSDGSLSYVEQSISYLEKLSGTVFNSKFFEEFPKGELELDALLFKTNFLDREHGKSLLTVLIGLANIHTRYSISNYTQNQLLKIKDKIMGQTTSSDTIETILFSYFKKNGKYYSFRSHKIIHLLNNPSTYFDDEHSDNFKVKKQLLLIQDFFTNIQEIDFYGIFKNMLLESIKENTSESIDNVLTLIAIDQDFYRSLGEIAFTKEVLITKIEELKNSESEFLKKPYNESVDYVLYQIEYYFDNYLVKGAYNSSQTLLEYLEACYKVLPQDSKARFHFQKSRQLVAQGEFNQVYAELTESIKHIKRDKDFWTLSVVLRLLAETYFINRQPLFGTYAFDQLFQLYARILPVNTRFKGYSLLKLSDRLNETGLFAYSLQNLEDALRLFMASSLSLEEITCQQKMADILYKLGQPELAVQSINRAIELVKDADKNFSDRLESIKNAFENPELYHPFFSYKNWLKINYTNTESLLIQQQKYKKIFEENKDKEISEDYLQQLLYYIRLSFKLGNIQELRLAIDYLERHIPTKSPNKGLIYLELSLLHNFLANTDVANYYSDLAKSSLFSVPIDYDISSKYQLNYISYRLYNGQYELGELLIQDQFLRKKRKNEAELYLQYAFLESHKNPPNEFEKYYDRGISLYRDRLDMKMSKQEIKSYGSGILRDQYINIFPIVNLPKKEVAIIEEIHWLFYKMSVDVIKSSFTAAIEKLSKVESLTSQLATNDWKTDISINYLKKLGQVYYNDKQNPDNAKKSIIYWQKALKSISELTKEGPLLYLFERLDLLYLIGKSSVEFNLLSVEEANKYLISGKNLIRKHNVHNSLQLEFQFDSALGMNFFEAKNYIQAIKYYTRALEKHNNKLYAELRTILLNLVVSYKETQNKEALEELLKKYEDYIKIFTLQGEIDKIVTED